MIYSLYFSFRGLLFPISNLIHSLLTLGLSSFPPLPHVDWASLNNLDRLLCQSFPPPPPRTLKCPRAGTAPSRFSSFMPSTGFLCVSAWMCVVQTGMMMMRRRTTTNSEACLFAIHSHRVSANKVAIQTFTCYRSCCRSCYCCFYCECRCCRMKVKITLC